MAETVADGLERLRDAQWQLGRGVRALFAEHGLPSVAAPGFEAPGVVVSYTDDASLAAKFGQAGLQVAAGVPLQCDEGPDFRSFRVGLFGLEKLRNVERSVQLLRDGLLQALGQRG
jgi:aspartate aminotransferase-like enzyme